MANVLILSGKGSSRRDEDKAKVTVPNGQGNSNVRENSIKNKVSAKTPIFMPAENGVDVVTLFIVSGVKTCITTSDEKGHSLKGGGLGIKGRDRHTAGEDDAATGVCTLNFEKKSACGNRMDIKGVRRVSIGGRKAPTRPLPAMTGLHGLTKSNEEANCRHKKDFEGRLSKKFRRTDRKEF